MNRRDNPAEHNGNAVTHPDDRPSPGAVVSALERRWDEAQRSEDWNERRQNGANRNMGGASTTCEQMEGANDNAQSHKQLNATTKESARLAMSDEQPRKLIAGGSGLRRTGASRHRDRIDRQWGVQAVPGESAISVIVANTGGQSCRRSPILKRESTSHKWPRGS